MTHTSNSPFSFSPYPPDHRHRKVQIVVFNKNIDRIQVLLLRTVRPRGGFWQNITGSVEEGESFFEGAQRELQEETGHFGLSNGKLLELDKNFFFRDRWGKWVEEKCFLFIHHGEALAVQLNPSEHDSYQWVDIQSVSLQHYHYPSNYEAFHSAQYHINHYAQV